MSLGYQWVPHSFFMQTYYFKYVAPKKEPKSLCLFRSTFYCPLDDQKPLEKTSLLIEKCKQCLLLQITIKLLQITSAFLITNYEKSVVTNYDILKIATGITNYDKIIINYQSYYKLRQNNPYSFGDKKKKKPLIIALKNRFKFTKLTRNTFPGLI